MQYVRLGRTGLKVSRLILGSTMFGELLDDAQAQAVIHRALELGVSTLDTGDIYAGGQSEEIIGRHIRACRNQLVICTKVGFRVGDSPGDHAKAIAGRLDHAARWTRGISPNEQGLSRRHIVSAVESSLRRLQTEYIDLYQVHRWDTEVPIEETLRALDDLIRSGKVRYVGCSNARSWQLYAALWTSDRCGLSRFESMQVPYSLLAPEAEHDVLPACLNANVGVIAYTVLAGGALSGRHNDGVRSGTVLAQRPAHQQRYLSPLNLERLRRFSELAAECGRSETSLALGAVLAHPAVTAATVGVQTPDELTALVEAVDVPMSSELVRRVRALFSIKD